MFPTVPLLRDYAVVPSVFPAWHVPYIYLIFGIVNYLLGSVPDIKLFFGYVYNVIMLK